MHGFFEMDEEEQFKQKTFKQVVHRTSHPSFPHLLQESLNSGPEKGVRRGYRLFIRQKRELPFEAFDFLLNFLNPFLPNLEAGRCKGDEGKKLDEELKEGEVEKKRTQVLLGR